MGQLEAGPLMMMSLSTSYMVGSLKGSLCVHLSHLAIRVRMLTTRAMCWMGHRLA